jgi:hypothetical protein
MGLRGAAPRQREIQLRHLSSSAGVRIPSRFELALDRDWHGGDVGKTNLRDVGASGQRKYNDSCSQTCGLFLARLPESLLINSFEWSSMSAIQSAVASI